LGAEPGQDFGKRQRAQHRHAVHQARLGQGVHHYYDGPWFVYQKNWSSPLNSTLTAWVSVNGARHRITMRAGSGNGNENDCTTNQGWLPDGNYSNNNDGNGDRDHFTHYYKDWGNSVVTGWVWDLGDKICYNGSKYRTELFIHSQGTGGWSDSNYGSAGCVKINQTDRSHLHTMFAASYGQSKGFLTVQS
ncbi:hypothetical protein ABZX92_38860, partial [Lentzea sp. NPDC006480]|uniref:hypothetical protein n=1 Tax=Lentzea sp. NPDC006480 TaxID=3157176 RepID=UPI0033ACFDA0